MSSSSNRQPLACMNLAVSFGRDRPIAPIRIYDPVAMSEPVRSRESTMVRIGVRHDLVVCVCEREIFSARHFNPVITCVGWTRVATGNYGDAAITFRYLLRLHCGVIIRPVINHQNFSRAILSCVRMCSTENFR